MYTIHEVHVESCIVKSGPQTCMTSLLYKCRTISKVIGFNQNLKNTIKLFGSISCNIIYILPSSRQVYGSIVTSSCIPPLPHPWSINLKDFRPRPIPLPTPPQPLKSISNQQKKKNQIHFIVHISPTPTQSLTNSLRLYTMHDRSGQCPTKPTLFFVYQAVKKQSNTF